MSSKAKNAVAKPANRAPIPKKYKHITSKVNSWWTFEQSNVKTPVASIPKPDDKKPPNRFGPQSMNISAKLDGQAQMLKLLKYEYAPWMGKDVKKP